MIWIGVIAFGAAGIAVILARKYLAELQSMVSGGRMPVGCVVAQGIACLLFALLIYLLRADIR